MTLGDKQRAFTRMIADLIQFAYNSGFELTFGDAFRDSRVHGAMGKKKSYSASSSNHKIRLAVDFNLFVNGEYITKGDHPAYIQLGEYWESLGGSWGGRFKGGDANHFSLEHNGRK
ncbi:M15 family metallopeptidase [Vibrio casei]|uniref:M15 family metallopeptidase n=1 Tax=Vibrio casei TaxID=673372 RepID=UPI003F96EA52